MGGLSAKGGFLARRESNLGAPTTHPPTHPPTHQSGSLPHKLSEENGELKKTKNKEDL